MGISRNALDLDPTNTTYYNNLATLYLNKKDYKSSYMFVIKGT